MAIANCSQKFKKIIFIKLNMTMITFSTQMVTRRQIRRFDVNHCV